MQSRTESTAVTANMGRAIHDTSSSEEHEKWEGPASSGIQASSPLVSADPCCQAHAAKCSL